MSSAFGAPVGGLLFSMEEVSSFWNLKLSWQTFFCCMISTFTTDLFNSAFKGFSYQGDFGLFKAETNIIFQVRYFLTRHHFLIQHPGYLLKGQFQSSNSYPSIYPNCDSWLHRRNSRFAIRLFQR